MNVSIGAGVSLGYDEAGSGAPIVLLHAFPLSSAMWRSQIATLRDDWRVIAPDVRGFGESGSPHDAPSVDAMADDVAALLDALKVNEPVVLVGLSMGGYIALAFARRHAARLRALVLADTKAEADNAEGKASRDKMIAFAQEHSASDVIEQMLPKLVGDVTRSQRPAVADEVRRIAAAQPTTGIIAALKALRDRPDATPSLGAIRVPTLVIVGAEDGITPPSAAETLAKGIAGARLATIAGAGHLSNLEQPDEFNHTLGQFLRSM